MQRKQKLEEAAARRKAKETFQSQKAAAFVADLNPNVFEAESEDELDVRADMLEEDDMLRQHIPAIPAKQKTVERLPIKTDTGDIIRRAGMRQFVQYDDMAEIVEADSASEDEIEIDADASASDSEMESDSPIVSDDEEEEGSDTEANDLYKYANAQQQRIESKEQIALLCAAILESPEENLPKLKVRIHSFSHLC